MKDYTGYSYEKTIRPKNKFRRLSEGGNGFNGHSDGDEFNGISLGRADLPASTKEEILMEAQKQIPRLTYDDLVLYVDQDNWSDDHIRVCIRNTGEEGTYIPANEEESPSESNESPKTDEGTVEGNSTTTETNGLPNFAK